jgi:hypothetical protein
VLSVNSITSHPQNREQELIYNHLLYCVRSESSDRVLWRFDQLLILNHYDDPVIQDALNQILLKADRLEALIPFFNRCCYILVNRWQLNPAERDNIGALITLIKQVQTPSNSNRYKRSGKVLRELVYTFSQSDYFSQLCRLAEFSRSGNRYAKDKPLVSLIDRYPYLYGHCLVNTQDNTQHRGIIKQLTAQTQQNFETDLSRYIAMVAVAGGKSLGEETFHGKKNPTLLRPDDLYRSMVHFVGPSTQQGGYRKSANAFIKVAKKQPTFQDFKEEVHRYIIADLDQHYVQGKFQQQLRLSLDSVSPEKNHQKMDNILMNRTFTQLMNFLVIESRRSPKHFIFMDLVSNIGTTKTVGLLLKIVLLGDSAKSTLERRLSLLFSHYENHQQGTVGWLVRCLEKFQLAFTSHFGRKDFSYLSLL